MISTNYEYNQIKGAFAKSLKTLRLYVGFSLVDLEKLTGINNPSLSRYENGKVEPSLTQAVIIAENFQLTVEDFILFGLGLKPENTDCLDIIDYFNQKLVDIIASMGENSEKLLRQLYKGIDFDSLIKNFL
ncbi:MAG: helix-turn-helix transcriptional regulator [Clostridia bacterium]|nr:helix-turn-helix transcriptional regulator [Clostridia bacterium]